MRRFDADNLPMPVDDMPRYRKTATTPMWPIVGPCVVITQEGEYPLPDGWVGFLAVDDQGHPYPISASTHAGTYAPAAPPDTLDGRPAGHTFEVECSAPHTFDDPKAIRLDGHELDPESILRDGFGFDFPDRGSNDPTLVRLIIACRRVEFANYLPDGSSLLWEQGTDPTDFEEER